MAVEYLAKEIQASNWGVESKFAANICSGYINGGKVILAKPTTYMNLSGSAVSHIKNYYKLDNQDILVIVDDKDITFGKWRYRAKGSSGGQNGLKDIEQKLGTQEYARIKIGIQTDKLSKMNTSDFVLSRFSPEEMEDLHIQFGEHIKKNIDQWLQ